MIKLPPSLTSFNWSITSLTQFTITSSEPVGQISHLGCYVKYRGERVTTEVEETHKWLKKNSPRMDTILSVDPGKQSEWTWK